MDKRLHVVVFLLFSLSAIVIMGSGDKTELLFHLLIVSILGFFALYVYHKQTVESFVCDKKVLDDELDGFYKSMLGENKDEVLKQNEPKIPYNSVDKKDDKLNEFYNALVKRDPLVEFTDGKHNGNEEYEKDGDFKNFFNSRAKESLQKFIGYDRNSNTISLGAPLDNTIGEYDGVTIDAEKYQYRRALMPGVQDCGVTMDQKCGDLSAPCKGVKINNPFHVTPEGKEIPLNFGHSKPDKLNKTVIGHMEPDQNMAMFSHNKSSVDCCPSTYSTSTGCVCTTTEQRNMISGRGTKSPYNH